MPPDSLCQIGNLLFFYEFFGKSIVRKAHLFYNLAYLSAKSNGFFYNLDKFDIFI